jgi:GNAT superfamily N-acetyltransferase
MRYRRATFDDAAAIAAVHAASWRIAYRGALRDAFLDGDIEHDRWRVWEKRLSVASANQLVVVVEDKDRVVGFACAYGGEDEQWGTLLDNIHVRADQHGQGTGTHLMSEVARWCGAYYPDSGLYLWVVEQNAQARRFYEGLGATDRGGDLWVPPGGGEVKRRRYVWSDVRRLVLGA